MKHTSITFSQPLSGLKSKSSPQEKCVCSIYTCYNPNSWVHLSKWQYLTKDDLEPSGATLGDIDLNKIVHLSSLRKKGTKHLKPNGQHFLIGV